MESIISNEKICLICGSPEVHLHHIYYGTGNRKVSDQNGFTCYLCYLHHNGSNVGVHFNHKLDLELKQLCQKKYEENHTREEFLKLINRSYL